MKRLLPQNRSRETTERELITLEHELDLPPTPGFVSRQLPVSPETAFASSEACLDLVNSHPRAAEFRLREKVNVPFNL